MKKEKKKSKVAEGAALSLWALRAEAMPGGVWGQGRVAAARTMAAVVVVVAERACSQVPGLKEFTHSNSSTFNGRQRLFLQQTTRAIGCGDKRMRGPGKRTTAAAVVMADLLRAYRLGRPGMAMATLTSP